MYLMKKESGVQMTQRRQTRSNYSRNSMSTVLMILLVYLFSTRVVSSCIMSPSESVVIVGDPSTFSCNARPNNEQTGSISNIRLGSDKTSGIEIFRPESYDFKGYLITKQLVADGYFLSHLDSSHSNATIQINETQLTNGGKYFCSCVESASNLGTANITVLEKLSFERIGDVVPTPGAHVDLDCSVSFNGSTSSYFIDLTIKDANGIQVFTKTDLPLISDVGDYHMVRGKVGVDQEEEQRFTCEMKVWKKSEKSEKTPLWSTKSNLTIDKGYAATTLRDANSTAAQATGRTTSLITVIVFGVIAVMYTQGVSHNTWLQDRTSLQ